MKIGKWFEARATGTGIREVRIIALPVAILMILLGILSRICIG